MNGAVSMRWALISVLVALIIGLALTRLTQVAWAPPVAMGVLMGGMLGVGRVLRGKRGRV
jgi:hypothetical protein